MTQSTESSTGGLAWSPCRKQCLLSCVVHNRSVITEFNETAAVRLGQQYDADGKKAKIKGKGMYKQWTAGSMLRVSRGPHVPPCQPACAIKRHLRLGLGQTVSGIKDLRSPTSYSLNSLAYWLSATSSTVGKASAALPSNIDLRAVDVWPRFETPWPRHSWLFSAAL